MTVLCLGPTHPGLRSTIEAEGDTVLTSDAREIPDPMLAEADFLVSYGYRYRLSPDYLARFPHRAINLHISYLPWNRGADPNLWSWIEDTPKGVTIHEMDAGLDTGPILAQAPVTFTPGATLRTSYEILSAWMGKLFAVTWPAIRTGHLVAQPQIGAGSSHRIADKGTIAHRLTLGWKTSVADLCR